MVSATVAARLLGLLCDLVEIESPTGETRALGERMAAELASLGGTVSWQPAMGAIRRLFGFGFGSSRCQLFLLVG